LQNDYKTLCICKSEGYLFVFPLCSTYFRFPGLHILSHCYSLFCHRLLSFKKYHLAHLVRRLPFSISFKPPVCVLRIITFCIYDCFSKIAQPIKWPSMDQTTWYWVLEETGFLRYRHVQMGYWLHPASYSFEYSLRSKRLKREADYVLLCQERVGL
jgi:hypothetical protein